MCEQNCRILTSLLVAEYSLVLNAVQSSSLLILSNHRTHQTNKVTVYYFYYKNKEHLIDTRTHCYDLVLHIRV